MSITAEFHLTTLCRKLDVHDGHGAMRYAFEHALIASPPLENGPADSG